MKKTTQIRPQGLTVIAASLSMVFGSALAQDNEEVTRLIRPESSVQFGAGYLSDDVIRFGQYSGLKDSGLYAIGNVDYLRRDDATGTWYRFDARNLGLESRSVRVEHERQGNWRYGIEYSKIPRYSQYVVNTGLRGIGDDIQMVTPVAIGAGFDKRLKTEREGVTITGQKFLGNGLDVQVRFKNETKEGDRLFGRGRFDGRQFLAEPIDQTMRQVDVILGFTGEKLQLSGGYYGSFFNNDNRSLTVFPFASGANVNNLSPIALPPDNEAHQLYLTGGYSFTPTTRANFKVARGIATQDDSFIVASAPGRSNLDGRVETTLLQAGLTARPMPKLSLLANFKYEDRDDETPVRQYFPPVSTTVNAFNEPRSLRSRTGKVEASYLLPADFRVIGGVDYEERRRNVIAVRQVNYREETDELSYRVELRRSLGETLNGSIGYVNSDRDGSRFQNPASFPVTGPVAPLHIADRERDKVRLKLDWAPAEQLSVQLLADVSRDDYSGAKLGLDDGRSTFVSLDASYSISDAWQALGWASREKSRIDNDSSTRIGTVHTPWSAEVKQRTEAFGLGLRGKLNERWKVGGDIQYSHDRSDYGLSGVPTATALLPDVKYTLRTLKLFAEYEMRQDLSVRFDAIHDRWSTNDWVWSSFAYSDGTTLSQDDSQKATFIGVSMRYAWR
ncbi:MAG: MtrB/PioB family decaheme-associated outer membrane protein [Aromatoleum sp.]|jgi:MtrB/PioB family decaheme-associated outer membrane protein|uniref:MtrB/PioB family decaheme-associated outer membrane protein n=1 Tax=Aromatoleum sp. TaxID=2307007 RepID=UPI002894C086|nr:MtrB/PioB family decaheme-associated outer membrane protein [Aromatoleum sp.]MDT3670749.1 MtrB/PioB family decaheme-associated outer membrane protein [Aromatoleum sp.]